MQHIKLQRETSDIKITDKMFTNYMYLLGDRLVSSRVQYNIDLTCHTDS